MKKSFTPSTLRTTEESEKIREESKNKESIILSSISTFKTLFNVKEKKERKKYIKMKRNKTKKGERKSIENQILLILKLKK